jgi:hypothetical protein
MVNLAYSLRSGVQQGSELSGRSHAPPSTRGGGHPPHDTERDTTMTQAQTNALVVKDSTGNLYLVAQETLEQGRIPEEHRAEVERMTSDEDTAGFFWFIRLPSPQQDTGNLKVTFQDILVTSSVPNSSPGQF